MAEDLNRLNARWQALRNERAGWESAWRDLALHFLPMGWRHDRDSRAGKKPVILNNRLVNSVGVLDMRTLTAGLQEMNPLQIVKATFENSYQTEMPEELVNLFQEACRTINLE